MQAEYEILSTERGDHRAAIREIFSFKAVGRAKMSAPSTTGHT